MAQYKNKTITTNITQTKLNGARPTGLAHKKAIKDINPNQHKRKKQNTYNTNYPNINTLLATSPHNIKHNHKTIKTNNIPKNTNLHAHRIHHTKNTPPPTNTRIYKM